MSLPDSKAELESIVQNGAATISDIAALFNSTPELVVAQFNKYKANLPSMALEGPFDFIKKLQKGVKVECKAENLLTSVNGDFAMLPTSDRGMWVSNSVAVYEKVHGKDNFIDPYSGEKLTSYDLYCLDGDQDNFLPTNLEVISKKTQDERFNHEIGNVTEVFTFSTRYFEIEIEISRKYDQMVGGTYAPEYMHNLFNTWVGIPLNMYFKRQAEYEPLFKHKNPMFIAWWAWGQLSNFGLLKGLKSLKVQSINAYVMDKFQKENKNITPSDMRVIATVTEKNVLSAVRKMVALEGASLMQDFLKKDQLSHVS